MSKLIKPVHLTYEEISYIAELVEGHIDEHVITDESQDLHIHRMFSMLKETFYDDDIENIKKTESIDSAFRSKIRLN